MNAKSVLRIVAKIWLVLVSAFWGFMLLGYAIGGDPYAVEGSEHEGIILGILMTYSIGSSIYSFKNEKLGSKLVIAAGIFLSIFALLTAGRYHLYAMAVSGGAFLVPGVALYILSRKS